MKLWIKNILQNIINRIESEEDTTPPEDYFKDIIEHTKELNANMKQEDKELLLKDLCARLPYGVKIKTSYDKIDEPIELIFINPRNESFAIGSNFTTTSGLSFDIYECKPYLIPMSKMTKEQM